jgi:hypothetical protein
MKNSMKRNAQVYLQVYLKKNLPCQFITHEYITRIIISTLDNIRQKNVKG